MATATYTLSDFLTEEMKKRNMSLRAFAAYIGVTHGTISRHLVGIGGVPGEEFLVKLSDKTGISLQTIFALAYPDVAERTAISPRVLLLAQRLDKLPESIQNFILRAAINE